MIATHSALSTVRALKADVDAKLEKLTKEHTAAAQELADADAALTHELGAERLGESSAGDVAAARKRQNDASRTLQSVAAARDMLTARVPDVERAVADAEHAFRLEAAELIRPTYERSLRNLRAQAEALAVAYREVARNATVAHAIPTGVLAGGNLLRVAGNPLEAIRREHHVQIDLGFLRDPNRLTEQEILKRLEWSAGE
jgi:hypothetical protein